MKHNSPYTASFTGGGFLLEETIKLIPLLLSEEKDTALKDEALNNHILMLNAESSRKRIIAEIKKRFDSLSTSFWISFLSKNEEQQRIANFYAILKTYKLIFDFHYNVIMRKWSSINRKVEIEDILMEIEEIAANDEFVEEWSDATKKKVGSAYLTILKRVNMIDLDNSIRPLEASDETFAEYLKLGEPWFLDFCLLPPYEVERIKSSLV